MTLTYGELFAGAGALGAAVGRVFEARPLWVAEIAPAPAAVLAYRYPEIPNLGDVTAVDWADPALRVDILAGGFPCQDVSSAGLRRGLTEGTRSGLWAEFARAIDAIRPRWVIIENVRGLLSTAAVGTVEPCPVCLGDDDAGPHAVRALGTVLGDLADIGYDARWMGLPADVIGAPHERFRVFILARAADPARE